MSDRSSDDSERGWENGIYMIADTPNEATPLLTESGDGDFELLEEFLHEHGFELQARDLEDFVEPADEMPDEFTTDNNHGDHGE